MRINSQHPLVFLSRRQPHRATQPMSAIRREIYGERPLAPMKYPPVLYRPRNTFRRLLWLALCALALGFIAVTVLGLIHV
jgi:hypothetical protein